jgi:hypothetical protein
MKLFDAIKVADLIRIYRDPVVEVEWYTDVNSVELSFPGRMGIGTMMFEDQAITLENGFASVKDVEGDDVTLEFLKTSPLE